MAEVIFAVMVLGIGLILLAAAFPVGIKQASKTQDMTNAALIAQHAYDQITKVPARGSLPTGGAGVGSWASTTLALGVVDQYAGKPLTMGLLDGSMTTDAGSAWPDLRAKLVYPTCYYAEGSSGLDLTYADDAPQAQAAPLGHAAYSGTDPVPFVNVWGFRYEGTTVYENVQWVYPGDRRYYWYAFYRQMHEGDINNPARPYPNRLATMNPWASDMASAVTLDHITRRTYRVSVVVCKTPANQAPILTPEQIHVRTSNNSSADYVAQWDPLRPVRLPERDGGVGSLAITNISASSVGDTASTGGPLNTRIQSGQIKRGGIVVDGWGNIYQIVDVGANQVRLDRDLPIQGGDLKTVLPLWFNPNAIAVFPTIVTKQADLP